MKKVVIAAVLLLAACGQGERAMPLLPDPVPEQVMTAEAQGLSLSLADDSFEGSPAAIDVILANESDHSAEYGNYFAIEMKRDGQWFALDHSDAIFYSDPGFRDTGEFLGAGQKAKQSCSVAALGETLLPGEYRFVKTFVPAGSVYKEVSVAVPFAVK